MGIPMTPVFDIPDLTISGVLPPFVGVPTSSAMMSPYNTTLVRVAQKFCGSAARAEIFRGFLAYRQELSRIGIVNGRQWLSGSFLEDIEALEKRDPQDVDIVTICNRPVPYGTDSVAWARFFNANLHLFDPRQTKAAFHCDARFIDLDIDGLSIVDQTRFWFGLFSHRRGGLWKGMLRVPLQVTQDDADASVIVRRL
jgi:hypothetical protein